jgi:hypothetical protein
MTEQFANNASSTLNGTITNVQTTLVVNSATSFPSVPQFRILVDTEIMLVTGVAGNTFTVSRGVENSGQTTHNNGVAVTHIFTAGAINQAKADAIVGRTPTGVKTAPYVIANTDDVVYFSTSGGSFTINLPATPITGESHMLMDTGGSAALNPLSVSGNGNNINGCINGTASSSIDTIGSNWGVVTYQFNGTSWNMMRNQNALNTRIPPDTSDLAVWTFQETAAPFANTGTGGTDSINVISGSTNPQAQGIVLPYSLMSGLQACQLSTTTTSSGTDTVIQPPFPITVSFWFKLTTYNTSGSAQHLVMKSYNPYSTWTTPFTSIEMTLTSSGSFINVATSIAVSGGGGGISANVIAGLGEWIFIGYIYDGANEIMYSQGSKVGTFARTGAIDYGGHGPWIFGQNPASTGEGNYVGYIQDVRVANVARPASWFRTVYRAGVGLSLP